VDGDRAGATRWHPVLRTSRDEIAETCRDPRYNGGLSRLTGEELAGRVERAAEGVIAQIAVRAGELVMAGGDYWQALPLAAEHVLGDAPQP
jgi:hypothetical protein